MKLIIGLPCSNVYQDKNTFTLIQLTMTEVRTSLITALHFT